MKPLTNLLFGTLTLALAGCVGVKMQNLSSKSGPMNPNEVEGSLPPMAFLMSDTNLVMVTSSEEKPASSEHEKHKAKPESKPAHKHDHE
ncbi:MAG: hypothetical protein ACR2H1_00665 [Limisphaerales bacterium]